MALEVEDGTGKANAEAFATVAFADTFAAKYAGTWTGWEALATEADKEPFMRKGADYLVMTYPSSRLSGCKMTRDQRLTLPRTDLSDGEFTYDASPLPLAWQEANALAAFKIAQGVNLLADLGEDADTKRKKLDVLEREFWRSPATRQIRGEMRREIHAKIAPFLVGTGADATAVRSY